MPTDLKQCVNSRRREIAVRQSSSHEAKFANQLASMYVETKPSRKAVVLVINLTVLADAIAQRAR